jgi:hypothetical protein
MANLWMDIPFFDTWPALPHCSTPAWQESAPEQSYQPEPTKPNLINETIDTFRNQQVNIRVSPFLRITVNQEERQNGKLAETLPVQVANFAVWISSVPWYPVPPDSAP